MIALGKALALVLVIVSVVRLDRRNSKAILRRLAAFINRFLLRSFSRPCVLGDDPVVIFAPHQDDETLGCGALIARRRHEGLPVHVIFITDGSASHPGHPRLTPAALVEIRRKEAREALAILGVESNAIHFLNGPDGMLPKLSAGQRSEIVRAINALLLTIAPGEVFLPCSPDGSSEHEAAFIFINEAIRSTGLRMRVWQYPVWSWWNPLLLLRHTVSSTLCCRLPAEDYHPMKLKALACYRSQIVPLDPEPAPSLPPELVRIFEADEEYFFHFDIPARAKQRQAEESYPAI